jgi:hypothetical protein
MNPNEPAFPVPEVVMDGREGATAYPSNNSGMTIRTYLAGLAMQGFCANSDLSAIASEKGKTPAEVRHAYAKAAVQMADLMLAELEKS